MDRPYPNSYSSRDDYDRSRERGYSTNHRDHSDRPSTSSGNYHQGSSRDRHYDDSYATRNDVYNQDNYGMDYGQEPERSQSFKTPYPPEQNPRQSTPTKSHYGAARHPE